MGKHHWQIEKMTNGDACFAMSTLDGYVGAMSRDSAESIRASHNADIDALLAGHDCLAAENAELRGLLALEQIPHADANKQLSIARAALEGE